MFDNKYSKFWQGFGNYKTMVLSTSLNDIVTSRMMSIVVIDKELYFQTDKTFRKYTQLKKNSNASLCIDNISIDGKCTEVGFPADNIQFCNAYKKYFSSSFNQYTKLKNERLFVLKPYYIQKWIYIDNSPYIEKFDIKNKIYSLEKYIIA